MDDLQECFTFSRINASLYWPWIYCPDDESKLHSMDMRLGQWKQMKSDIGNNRKGNNNNSAKQSK